MIKISVNLPEEDYEAVKQLAERRKTSFTQVLRQAISSERFLEDVTRQGGKILVEQGKQVREIVFR